LFASLHHSLVRKIPRPGRKTNAEHAIAFYRHVLALNEGEEESEEEEEVSETEEEKPKASNKPRKMRVLKQDESASLSSMDSEEFREQHNDLCEVCNDAGELICCSTCNLVFHLHCIRPPTTRFPPDKWCCAYCVAAGVRGHSKEARTRRRAAAAAREMTRMKEELNPQECKTSAKDTDEAKKDSATKKKRGRPPQSVVVEGEETDDAKEEDDATQDETNEPPHKKRRGRTPNRAVESEETDEAKEGEPQAKKVKAEEEGESQPEESEEAAEKRTRRERRQPALFNPQAGAASAWQSDGKLEWKTLGNEDGDTETGDDNTSKGTDDKESDDESGSLDKTIWCNFCHDDPSVSVCCFCACRTCFGKHDKVSLYCENDCRIQVTNTYI